MLDFINLLPNKLEQVKNINLVAFSSQYLINFQVRYQITAAGIRDYEDETVNPDAVAPDEEQN